jgi:putative restriction endonuclease
MRYWWVNQKQTWRQEVRGGFMWSPKQSRNGRRNPFYDYMRIVAPGDIVFSFVDSRVFAIGVAQSTAFESPKPEDFGNAGMSWEDIGWRVNVAFRQLEAPFLPRDHMDRLGPVQPPGHAPLRPNGLGKANIYLTEIPEAMALVVASLTDSHALHLVRGIVGREAAPTDMISGLEIKAQWEDTIETEIIHREFTGPTDRQSIIRARRGQGVFRENLLSIEHGCRISHVTDPDYLIASHIKPWRHGGDEERIDGENGLLLCPNADLLFDRGLISFEDSGDVIVSPVADETVLPRLGVQIDPRLNVGSFTSSQKHYLQFHRDSILLKAS